MDGSQCRRLFADRVNISRRKNCQSLRAFLHYLPTSLVGLLSIVPTIEFLSWRKAVRDGKLPEVSERKLGTVRTLIHLELAGIVVILLAAAIMAKGGWV